MKLNKDQIAFVRQVAETAQMINVESIIIEPDTVRGMNDSRSAVIFQAIPTDTNFGSIGLNRIDVLLSRLDIVEGDKKAEITVKMDGEFVQSLMMKGNGAKINYRCAAPATIQAPKAINNETETITSMSADSVALLSKAVNAMGNAEDMTIIGNDDGISVQLADINQDEFFHTFAPVADSKFSYKYSSKLFMTLLKKHPSGEFEIGKKGAVKFVFNGLGIYLIPKV